MSKRAWRLVIFFSVNAAILASLIFFARTTLGVGVTYCRFHILMNMYCPGCGMTRAVWALLHLDLLSAARYNICVFPIVSAIIYYDVRLLVSIIRGDMRTFARSGTVPLWVMLAVLVVNFAVQNILLRGFGIDLIGDFLTV